eukprot:CAMPEP_0202907660 /NCGR_PEP_ID=MMETSP1392-20130828/43419_1 /ASSEMBLY_ACC=CAM_ASM_000868 /TAXON_ID=225041 /ORGANISM="Chlamydomonas chlamydogama, Strain SAG 11-48b" /LENGTH=52 /DNA_ID=CAMNT_0049596667 /DNA_START=1 /DNA_END=156 /DNA_ORIENTATION=+
MGPHGAVPEPGTTLPVRGDGMTTYQKTSGSQADTAPRVSDTGTSTRQQGGVA